MELRHLRVLIAVADELHFGRAADRLNLSQPSVSGQIRQLERELDVRLLERSARRVALTEAGRLFVDDAKRIVDQADAARLSVRSWRTGHSGRLRIGYLAGAHPRALAAALRDLSAGAERPAVRLTTGGARTLIGHVRDGSLDVAIVSLPAPVAGLTTVPFADEHAMIAVRAGMFDGREPEVPIEVVAREVVLSEPRRMNPGFHDAVLSAFRASGRASPLLEIEGASPEQLLLQVAAGAGMALVAESVAEQIRVPGVAFRRLMAGPPVSCRLAAVAADPVRTSAVSTLLAALARPAAPRAMAAARGDGTLAVIHPPTPQGATTWTRSTPAAARAAR